jgi:hypothetical protein
MRKRDVVTPDLVSSVLRVNDSGDLGELTMLLGAMHVHVVAGLRHHKKDFFLGYAHAAKGMP